jgi:hypothetical protein
VFFRGYICVHHQGDISECGYRVVRPHIRGANQGDCFQHLASQEIKSTVYIYGAPHVCIYESCFDSIIFGDGRSGESNHSFFRFPAGAAA